VASLIKALRPGSRRDAGLAVVRPAAYRRVVDEPGGDRQHRPDDETPAGGSSDLLEFGGYRSRWLPHLSRRVRASTIEVAVISLAAGLIIGYAGGHLSAHPARPVAKPAAKARVTLPLLALAPPIADTGGRCAMQVGKHLELGIEIVNQSSSAVGIGRITPVFDLGGFRPVATGLGTCGALSGTGVDQPPLLFPGATEWITTTVEVLDRCPQALPVGFKVRFAQAGKRSATVFNAFPDLGQIPYRGCATASP
jgi:hypothetical protein